MASEVRDKATPVYLLRLRRNKIANLLLIHIREEIVVGLGGFHFVQQELDGVDGAHWVEDAAKDPHFLQRFLIDQQFFLTRAGFLNIDRREDAFIRDLAVEHDFGVTRAFEFLEDDLVHTAAGVDQRGGDDGEAAALFDVTRSSKETFRTLQRVGVDAAGENFTR